MTNAANVFRSELSVGRDGFGQLVRAEWTKFRTVRGWLIGLLVAAVVTVLVGVLASAGGQSECGGGGASGCRPRTPLLGPDGEPVSDAFYFVHQPLTGNGNITVRLASLTGLIPGDDRPGGTDPATDPAAGTANSKTVGSETADSGTAGMRSGLQEWAKAGLIVKQNANQGSSYAAVMMTAAHGIRLQYNYIHDTAGAVSAASSRWLRLSRTGDTLTGYQSADGSHWSEVGTAVLPGLASTVSVGLFVASPDYQVTTQRFGGSDTSGGSSQATALFDHLTLNGSAAGGWQGTDMGGSAGGGAPTPTSGFAESDGSFIVRGSGDIAPAVAGPGPGTVERSLVGAFAGLIVVIVLGTLFVTSEYRRGLIRTTLAATPRRGRMLAAKSIVIGGVTFGTGLVASALAFWVVGWLRGRDGVPVFGVSWLTELRVVVGTAALLAVAAVMAMAVGTIIRRSAGATAVVIVLIVLPYILAVASVLPTGPAQWLLRLTPAAAFAIQQSTPEYAQVAVAYMPSTGYYPLAPLAGFAVLCGWTALALGLATVLLRRRDV